MREQAGGPAETYDSLSVIPSCYASPHMNSVSTLRDNCAGLAVGQSMKTLQQHLQKATQHIAASRLHVNLLVTAAGSIQDGMSSQG